jgi:hypothetical protein
MVVEYPNKSSATDLFLASVNPEESIGEFSIPSKSSPVCDFHTSLRVILFSVGWARFLVFNSGTAALP